MLNSNCFHKLADASPWGSLFTSWSIAGEPSSFLSMVHVMCKDLKKAVISLIPLWSFLLLSVLLGIVYTYIETTYVAQPGKDQNDWLFSTLDSALYIPPTGHPPSFDCHIAFCCWALMEMYTMHTIRPHSRQEESAGASSLPSRFKCEKLSGLTRNSANPCI